MEPDEAPGIAAQVEVALAGFAGVVVVFRRQAIPELPGENLLYSFGLVKTTIVHRELSSA
jgi:hypothetical protein